MTSKTTTLKQRGAKFWNANPCGGNWPVYSEYLEWLQQVEPYLFGILCRYHWEGKRVVEIGCGQGAVLNYVAARGAVAYGLDASSESLRRARDGADELGHAFETRFLCGDAERLPFASGVFDVAISIGVLHHTADTAGCVREIHRLLKRGGTAIVMLYRRGNPKWWATRTLRAIVKAADLATGESAPGASWLRLRQRSCQTSGTAWLELFGVPILKAFTPGQTREMFGMFETVQLSNHQPGFVRLGDVLPLMHHLHTVLRAIDRRTANRWGFYQVIEATKG